MAQLLVRSIDDDVKQRLRERAASNARSLEAEARAILTNAVEPSRESFGDAWANLAETYRKEHGGVDLVIPDRLPPREVSLS
ncbi:MAG: toxin-antitoxin system antitoxin subunit [Promicromonosporaceae bacterium]|nr:toxin-antitoxin system antitoxin subunit [Promicromonosporaceae bacterium]